MKYEMIFGDQSLFDGAPECAVIAIKRPFISGVRSEEMYFFSSTFDAVMKAGSSFNFNNVILKTDEYAERRIIAEPKRWTLEDKKAGRLPEVGVKVRDKPSGVIGEVAAVDGQLLDTGVFVKSLPEYLVVVGLYQMAGCKIWPWHEGYKEPNYGDERSLYVYKDVGFFKEIYPVAVGVKVLTIPELVEIVTGKQAAKAQAVSQWIPVSERLPENNSGIYLCSGHEGTKFVCYRRHNEWIRSPQMKRVVGITHWMPITPAPVQAKDGE